MRGLFLAVVALGVGLAGCVGEPSEDEEVVDSVSNELGHEGARVPDGSDLKGLDAVDDDQADEEAGSTGFSGPGDLRSEPVPHPWVPKTKTAGVRDNDA